MKTRFASRTALIVAGVIATLSAASLVGTAVARHSMMTPPPAPVIATVDLEGVVAALKERLDKELNLKASLSDAQKRVDTLVEEVKSDQEKIKQMPAGNDKDKAMKELREKAIRAEFEKQYAQKLLIEMQGEMLRDLYLKISEATGRMAKSNGYSLVIANDQKIEIPKGDPNEIGRAISSKRMLYSDGALDVTNELITMMNNEYAARGGGR
jgi:Skp family chaperone for outer membrane proteins